MAYTTVNKPELYFKPVLYTGNSGTQSITGVGFQPDWTWIKSYSATRDHAIFDIVRGATKWIDSHQTAYESTVSGVTSFDSDGFSLGSNVKANNNSENYVAWNWKGGGSGSANTDGDINSTVSASTAAGFSIVKWTGDGANTDQEIGTGLSEELKFVISKPLDSGGGTGQWLIYVNGVTDAQGECMLFTTGAKTTNASSGTPNKGTTAGRLLLKAGSSNNQNLNTNALNYIAYCFAEKKGYSKFGTYIGNGNADGTFIYLGFKPAFIMVKSTTSTTEWHMSDNGRKPTNPNNSYVSASSNASQNTSAPTDFLSNGVKIKTSNNGWNQSGQTFIYMAFAEEPLVANVAQGVPATAK